jgi:hypothetical protein
LQPGSGQGPCGDAMDMFQHAALSRPFFPEGRRRPGAGPARGRQRTRRGAAKQPPKVPRPGPGKDATPAPRKERMPRGGPPRFRWADAGPGPPVPKRLPARGSATKGRETAQCSRTLRPRGAAAHIEERDSGDGGGSARGAAEPGLYTGGPFSLHDGRPQRGQRTRQPE